MLRRPARLVQSARACLRHYSGPNDELVQMLTRYMEAEKASPSSNAYKVRAYLKAINTIGQLSEQVRSVDQVRNLEGIGARIAKRIDAHLCGTPYEPPAPSRPGSSVHLLQVRTRTEKTLDKLRREQVVSSLSSISGIGSLKANSLYDAGCRSIQELREPKFFQMLSHRQQVNAQYTIGLDRTITREQASTVRDFVVQNLSSDFTIVLGGDFRRGAASAEHIVLVVLHPQIASLFPPEGSLTVDSTIRQMGKHYAIPSPFTNCTKTKARSKGLLGPTIFSTEIISPLERQGLAAATIILRTQRWDAVIRVPERIKGGWETRAERTQAVQECKGQFFSAKIYHVPQQCAGAALITLTGDLEFNLAIRRAASRLGLRLNEYGLWRWRDMATMTGVDDVEQRRSIESHGGCWELVASRKEEDIFEAIGMEWVAPEKRNFTNLGTHLGRRQGHE